VRSTMAATHNLRCILPALEQPLNSRFNVQVEHDMTCSCCCYTAADQLNCQQPPGIALVLSDPTRLRLPRPLCLSAPGHGSNNSIYSADSTTWCTHN
jgi:hypothetical protein